MNSVSPISVSPAKTIVRMSVDLPTSVYKAVSSAALERDQKKVDVIRQAIHEYLIKHQISIGER